MKWFIIIKGEEALRKLENKFRGDKNE